MVSTISTDAFRTNPVVVLTREGIAGRVLACYPGDAGRRRRVATLDPVLVALIVEVVSVVLKRCLDRHLAQGGGVRGWIARRVAKRRILRELGTGSRPAHLAARGLEPQPLAVAMIEAARRSEPAELDSIDHLLI